MIINKIEVDEGRDIVIIDDALNAGEHSALYDTCISLEYTLSNTSNQDVQGIDDKRFAAKLPQARIDQILAPTKEGAELRKSLCPDCGNGKVVLPEDNIVKVLFDETNRMNNFNSWIDPEKYYFQNHYVNLGLVNDSHNIHVDAPKPGHGKTVLIYPNKEWKPEWGGETVFYEEDMKELVYLNPYVPGRILIFDGSIPHCAKPQALRGPKYRFTIAMKFFSKEIDEKGGGVQMVNRDAFPKSPDLPQYPQGDQAPPPPPLDPNRPDAPIDPNGNPFGGAVLGPDGSAWKKGDLTL
jgi:hypothetical protein|tara:strand:- start:140 stop:1024 length:885 start_codon:yes stop_codon:yes gene_type:complete